MNTKEIIIKLQVHQSYEILDNNDLSEGEAEIPVCVTDTMLTATDFLEDSERQNTLNITPAEGNRPFLCFLLMRFLLISVILHEQQINCILYSIV